MMRSLAVGPPSLEQLAFEYDLGRKSSYAQPHLVVRDISFMFDEPRLHFNALFGWRCQTAFSRMLQTREDWSRSDEFS